MGKTKPKRSFEEQQEILRKSRNQAAISGALQRTIERLPKALTKPPCVNLGSKS